MTRTGRWSLVGALAASLAAGAAFAGDAPAEPDKKTERLWKAKCSSCHGMDGKAQTAKGKEMKVADYSTPAWQKGRDDAQLKKAIVEGVKAEKDGVKQEMEGYGDLKADQVDALISYIRWIGKK